MVKFSQFLRYLKLELQLSFVNRKLARCESAVRMGATLDLTSLKERQRDLEDQVDGLSIGNR